MIEDFFKFEQNRIIDLIKETGKIIYHKGEEGKECESILKLFLERYLPKKYSIGSGLIISKDKNLKSNQVDLIIYDTINSPLLSYYESLDLLPIECIYTGIEVKKRLNKNEDLTDILKKIEKIKSLPKKNYLVEKNTPIQFQPRIFETLGFGFIFLKKEEFNLKKVHRKIVDYYRENKTDENHMIDIFCILDEGVIIRKDKGFEGIKRIETKENTLLTFLLLLIQNLSVVYVGTVDLYSRSNFETNYIEIDEAYPVLSYDV